MSQFEFVSCRLAIQICTGHFPDGRERHRTFSVKDIKPDADNAALIAVVRAIGSLLAYPVTKARLIVKSRRVLFDAKRDADLKESVTPETRGDTPKTPGRETKPRVSTNSVFAEPTKLTKTAADVCLFFRTFLAAFRTKKGCNLWPIQTTLSMEYGGKQ